MVAAGGWTPALLGKSGLTLDARPTRETVAYFAGEPIASIIDERGGAFFALTAPGVGVKAGWHKAGRDTDPENDQDLEPDERILDAVGDWVSRRLPNVDPTPLGAETCIYTNIEDERFVCERDGRYVDRLGVQRARLQVRAGGGRARRGPRRALLVGGPAGPSSAKSGRRNSSNVCLSQLATTADVSARTLAVRGTLIASATSPK